LRGKVVVLAYFASYCPYCMQEAPKLQRLYREHGSRLAVVGVNIEEGDARQADKVREWVARFGWTFPVTGEYAALRRVLGKLKGLPVVQVIDRQGVLRQVEVGEMLDEDFDDIAAFAARE
jgi:thiol-disulfide isomerase/thioredoxin